MLNWVCLFFVLGPSPPATFRGDKDLEPEIMSLIDKIDQKNATIESLRATFRQHKEISLLTEPLDTEGVFYLKKSEGMRFEFQPGDDLTLIINKEEMVSLSPGAKKASRFKIKRRRGLIQKLLSDRLGTLTKYFDLELLPSETGQDRGLLLKPAKRKVRKRFQEIRIWVGGDDLIRRLKVVSDDGDVMDLTLEDITIDAEVPSELFDTTIPEDFTLEDRMDFLFGADAGF